MSEELGVRNVAKLVRNRRGDSRIARKIGAGFCGSWRRVSCPGMHKCIPYNGLGRVVGRFLASPCQGRWVFA